MNVKDLINVFSNDVLDEITRIEKENEALFYITIVDKDSVCKCPIEIMLDLICDDKIQLDVTEIKGNLYTMSYKTLSLITKIKSQWEKYCEFAKTTEKAFDEQMEKETMFEHLKKMSIRKD
ncbi:MAG: hypothetical protein ACOX1F_00975 [Erysipelotrichaceae bacterium]